MREGLLRIEQEREAGLVAVSLTEGAPARLLEPFLFSHHFSDVAGETHANYCWLGRFISSWSF